MAQKRPNLVQNLHFWSFWAKYCHFLHILSNAQKKNNVNKVPRWVFCYVGNKTFDFSSKKKDFCPKRPNMAQNWHFWLIWARPCRFFGALLVGRLAVVARGLYLARHLFTLFICFCSTFSCSNKKTRHHQSKVCSVSSVKILKLMFHVCTFFSQTLKNERAQV